MVEDLGVEEDKRRKRRRKMRCVCIFSKGGESERERERDEGGGSKCSGLSCGDCQPQQFFIFKNVSFFPFC